MGKVGIADSDLCFSQDCQALLFDKELVEPKFVAQQMVLATKRFHRVSRGTTINGVTKKEFRDTPFFLCPTEEQRRISSKVEELFSDLDASVAALERARANLKRYRAAVLKAAVEGRLTAQWRKTHPAAEPASQLLERILAERRRKWEQAQLAKFTAAGKAPPKGWKDKYPEPAKPDTTNLPELPEGWCWSSLGQCFHVAVGATPSRKEMVYWEGDIPWVSSGEVQFCRIHATREHISKSGLENSSTRINPAKSVMLGMIGEGKTRGQAAILEIEAANNQNCAAIWVPETPIPAEFVYYWLYSRYEETRTRGSGNNQPALNKTLVEQMPLPLAPLEEQNEIVRQLDERLSSVEAGGEGVLRGLSRAARLRQSILKRAFEGKLVPQDPNDEPAAVLLERIRAARADVPKTVTRRGRKPRDTALQ